MASHRTGSIMSRSVLLIKRIRLETTRYLDIYRLQIILFQIPLDSYCISVLSFNLMFRKRDAVEHMKMSSATFSFRLITCSR